jgi:low affinity Fe/Cu permease
MLTKEKKEKPTMNSFRFSYLARRIALVSGRPAVFMLALAAVLLWALSGPLFGFSDTWQLVINTSTTIITFLMVFLIQNTQNRDTAAIQLKLDELIRATKGAHNVLLDLEEIEDELLERYLKTYHELAAVSRRKIKEGKLDTDTPEVKQFSPE